jgi:osomolarity two-component system response regulator SSK1
MLDPEQSAKAPLNNNHTGTQFTLPKAIPRLDRTKLRPRLPNLRSPWTGQQTTQESEDSDEQALKIKLSDIKPESVVLKGLLSELALLASLASLLCFASAALLIPHHFPILYSGFMGLWLLIPAWITFGRSEHNTQLFHSIVRCSGFGGVVMALATCFHGNKLPTILTGVAICIFYITSRLFDCQHELHSQVYQLVENEQKRAQTEVDKSIAAYLNKRTTFLGTVSQEIRDAALMVIATLEQFSPTSILANTHELLSACSIAVPIASISAINTTIIQACHISSHLRLVSKMLNQFDSHTIIPKEDRLKSTVREEFDIGELVQNVGDALAGISAKLGVHFVIYHSDNELHYTNVIGDENAIKHALINASIFDFLSSSSLF